MQMLVQSLEGIFLLLLTLAAWPRLKALPTLVRQWVLMIPFFLVLLALPKPVPKQKVHTRDATRKELVGAGNW